MTTERQRAANGRNAARSTGPKSAVGQARASRNARRHGLTARPEPAEIDKWICIITGSDQEVDLPDPQDPAWPVLLRLAEAEAHLERVRDYQVHLLAKDQEGPILPNKFLGDLATSAAEQLRVHHETPCLSRDQVRGAKQRLDMFHRHFWKTTREARNIRRRVQRYRTQAEARREKALSAWIEVQKTKRTQFQP